MATVTSMRKVFLHTTDEFLYIVPVEYKDEFFKLLLAFFNHKTQANKDAFLNRFGHYQKLNEPPAQELYVPEVGIYDKRRDHL